MTGFANGLFGSGGGTIVVPAMERFLGEEEHKAHATAIAVILPLSLLSLGVYLWKADLGAVWRIALWASAGGLVGGFVGAKLLQRVSGVWLHRIFGAFMLAALALLGLAGAAAGAFLAVSLESEILKKLFGGFLLLMGLSEIFKKKKGEDTHAKR